MPTTDARRLCAGVTNVALMKGAPGRTPKTVEELAKQVGSIRKIELATRALRWHPEFVPNRHLPESYFSPLTFALWGAFDVALTFISPDLYLTNAPGPLTAQQVQRGLLVSPPESDLDPSQLLELWSESNQPKLPFFAFIKLKIQPENRGEGISRAIRYAQEYVAEWREAAPTLSRRQAVVSLGLGWSEILLLAQSDSVACLCQLVSAVRALRTERREWVFAVSNSKLGYSHELVELGLKALDDSRQTGEVVRADQLAEVALKAAAAFQRSQRVESKSGVVVLRPGFAVPPGAERRFCSRLSEALEALPPDFRKVIDPRGRSILSQTGSHDLFGPAVWFGSGLPDVEVAVFLRVLQAWLLADGKPDRSSVARHGLFLSCETNVRWEAALSVSSDPIDDIPHPPLRPESVEKLDETFLELDQSTRRAAQTLQLPYGRTEQLLNLIGTLRWAQQRPVVWEDSIALAPVVLCLVSYLSEVARTWPKWLASRRSDESTVGDMFRAGNQLHQELMSLGQEFQSSFYNRHLSGYLTDDVPDINLRYRGSIQQLLNVSNLILDSMVEVVLGRRACLATLGETTSPTIDSRCTVIVVNLQADTIRHPALLDTIGHEVGHQLVADLEQIAKGEFQFHSWTADVGRADSLKEVIDSFQPVWENVLSQHSMGGRALEEAVADYVEWQILGASFDRWAQSLMLRALLVAAPLAPPDGSLEDDVPVPRPDVVESIMIRLCIVRILDELGRLDPEKMPSGWDWHEEFIEKIVEVRLEELRQLLRTRCVVGPSESLRELLNSEWSREVVWKRVIGAEMWIDSPDGLKTVGKFVWSLRRHLERRCTDSLWLKVRAAMERLRTATLEDALPALHIRHWIPWAELDTAIQEATERGDVLRPGKWQVSVQPVDTVDLKPRSLIFQRGRVVHVHREAADRVRDAEARFVLDLLTLVPEWRSRLIRRVSDLAERPSARVAE